MVGQLPGGGPAAHWLMRSQTVLRLLPKMCCHRPPLAPSRYTVFLKGPSRRRVSCSVQCGQRSESLRSRCREWKALVPACQPGLTTAPPPPPMCSLHSRLHPTVPCAVDPHGHPSPCTNLENPPMHPKLCTPPENLTPLTSAAGAYFFLHLTFQGGHRLRIAFSKFCLQHGVPLGAVGNRVGVTEQLVCQLKEARTAAAASSSGGGTTGTGSGGGNGSSGGPYRPHAPGP